MKYKKSYILFYLFIILSFSVSRLSAQISEAQKKRAEYYYKNGNEMLNMKEYARAGESFAKSVSSNPNNRDAAFKAAKAFAIVRDTSNAARYARIALKLGMYSFGKDKNFKNIKNAAPFRTIIKEANEKLTELEKQPVEPVVLLPKGYDPAQQYPMIVALHGYGSNPADFANTYRAVAKKFNCILLLCRGSDVLGTDAYGWTYKTEEYDSLYYDIKGVIDSFSVNKNKVVLTGFSQGGYLTYSFGIIHSGLFCGLLPVAGKFPGNADVAGMKNKSLKVFSIIGTKDLMVYRTQNTKAQNIFKANGIPFQLKKYYVGHDYPDNKDIILEQAFTWFFSQ